MLVYCQGAPLRNWLRVCGCRNGQVEGQKAEQVRVAAEQAALSKLDRIRIDQTSRADALEREAREAEAKAGFSCSHLPHPHRCTHPQSLISAFC